MKNNLFAKALVLVLLGACTTEIDQETQILPEKKAQKTSVTKVHFQGLEVNHRFAMPAQYFDDAADSELMPAVAHNNSQSLMDFSLEDVAEVTQKVFKRYPYPSEEKNFTTDFTMIKKDFPNLNEKEIIKNEAILDKYYGVNLDYEVLQILKKTKKPVNKKEEEPYLDPIVKEDDPVVNSGGGGGSSTPTTPSTPPYNPNCTTKMPGKPTYGKVTYYSNKIASKIPGGQNIYHYYGNASCIIKKLKWYHTTALGAYAMVQTAREANRIFGYGGDNEIDARRHIFWSALLCKYYITILASKVKRINFAKDVGDANEYCSDNYVDAAQMDFHNNKIGRDLFDKLSTYKTRRFLFWTITYDISIPSNVTFKQRSEYLVNGINGKGGSQQKNLNVELGNRAFNYDSRTYKGLSSDQKICYRKHWIKYHADKDDPVTLIK